MSDKLKRIVITLDSAGGMSINPENVSTAELCGMLSMAAHMTLARAAKSPTQKPKKAPKKKAKKL